jgi:hypothetical protein
MFRGIFFAILYPIRRSKQTESRVSSSGRLASDVVLKFQSREDGWGPLATPYLRD